MRRISKSFFGESASLSRRFASIYAVAALAIILAIVSIRFLPDSSEVGIEIIDRRYEPDDIFISVEPIGIRIQSGEEMKPATLDMMEQVLEQRMIASPGHVDVMVYWRKGVSFDRVYEVLDELKQRGFTRIRLSAES